MLNKLSVKLQNNELQLSAKIVNPIKLAIIKL